MYKKCVFGNVIKFNAIDMYMANDEQSKLAKLIREFKNKARPPHNSKLRQVKEDVINRAMSLHKGREMVFKAFAYFRNPKKILNNQLFVLYQNQNQTVI